MQDERRMARFAQYAMVASEEALDDAGWLPEKDEDLEATVQRSTLTSATPYSCNARACTWDRALGTSTISMTRLLLSKKGQVESSHLRLLY